MGVRMRPVVAALLACGITAVAAAAGVAVTHDTAAPAAVPPGLAAGPQVPAEPAEKPLFTFVSMPDFLNADIGDTRLRAGRGWDPGDPITLNPAWEKALDTVLDEVDAVDPDVVLVAGDLVQGHWGEDANGTGIFGPTTTSAEKLAAISNAGDLYYAEWQKRFDRRGLRVLPAVGDHEVGDNPWPAGAFKTLAVPAFKDVWARHFTLKAGGGHRYSSRPVGTPWENTAYAVRIGKTLLVTVDQFKNSPYGMQVTVDGGQLRWLDRILGAARGDGVEHIVVQGHAPVLGPVRARHSSQLQLEGGADSPFWQTLKRHGVDLYLCGEVHDITTVTDGPVQVSHGALAGWAEANFLRGRVYADRIELDLQEFDGTVGKVRRMWQTTGKGRPHATVSFSPGTTTVGSMTIDKRSGFPLYTDRTGLMIEGLPLMRRHGAPPAGKPAARTREDVLK
jgi:hypothetical protein